MQNILLTAAVNLFTLSAKKQIIEAVISNIKISIRQHVTVPVQDSSCFHWDPILLVAAVYFISNPILSVILSLLHSHTPSVKDLHLNVPSPQLLALDSPFSLLSNGKIPRFWLAYLCATESYEVPCSLHCINKCILFAACRIYLCRMSLLYPHPSCTLHFVSLLVTLEVIYFTGICHENCSIPNLLAGHQRW